VYDGEGRNTDKCIETLRDHGYRIVAASPHKEEYGPEDMDITTQFALFLGGEKEGLSESVIREADAFLRIPMVGFTESFNLSVAGGILLYTLTQRLRRSGIEWELSPEEKDELRLAWAMKSVPRAEQLIRKFQQLT
jgi:tRNA (guanosine-2'-O-)-methyltransferase